MLITIHSDYRDADQAYQLVKFLRSGIGFDTLSSDLTKIVMYKDEVTQYELGYIMNMIAEYWITCDIDFKTVIDDHA